MEGTILILGAAGQIGTDLVSTLRQKHGNEKVIASDIREPQNPALKEGPFEIINAMDEPRIREVVGKYNVRQVYHLVAMLSATAEKMPEKGWDLNMTTLFHVLNLAKEGKLDRVFWPSSIAAFGPTTPRTETPQHTVMDPTTVYGISKLAGELWCQYYFQKFGVDVRSIRYPGLISWKSEPGGGTTDYAVDIFYKAIQDGKYTSFLDRHTALPMMYMEDAIRATINLMEAPAEKVIERTSYNVAAMSFTPGELGEAIKKRIPSFELDYEPDFRQKIAEGWPQSIDDSKARKDWGWAHAYDLEAMVDDMLTNLRKKLQG